jgi:hypothetical protein
MHIIKTMSYFYNCAKFILHKHIHGYEVGTEPAFDPEGLAAFREKLRGVDTYVEFGSGGSTILAASQVRILVSVESDPVFSRAVAKRLPSTHKNVFLLCPDVGPTAEWGTPVFGRPTPSRIEKWKAYPKAPWPVLGGHIPQLVLIDGRFRSACALETLLNVDRSTTILFDDYFNRDYSVVEQFADVQERHGFMAEFRKRGDFDADKCRPALQAAYADIR